MSGDGWTFLLSGFAIGVSVATIVFNVTMLGWRWPWRRRG